MGRGVDLKRIVDVVGSVIGLVALAPVLALIALVVRIGIGTPVLFRQLRPGLGGEPFTLVKFRTMTDARGSDGGLLEDAVRLTRVGAWLRSASLDELPELYNVLRGDMSLVGPRPLLMEYLPRYSREQARRHEVKPGLTGWAQVHGRNDMPWPEKLALDVWYVDNRGLWLDLRILLSTVAVAIGRKGVSMTGHATTPRFGEDGASR